MKRKLKTIVVLLLSCVCLAFATACANKSECNVPEQSEQTLTSDIEPLPECPDCPPDPDRPGIPEDPENGDNKSQNQEGEEDNEGNDEHKPPRPARPFPIRRRLLVKFLPLEIVYDDGENVYFVIFTSDEQ